MARILHAADIHLDSPLQKLARYEGAPVDKIRGASRRALEAMADLAIRQQVDLVVIAGDLYDGDWVDQNTGLFFVRIAGQLVSAGIPLVVIRGNHDAANVMTRSLPLPKNPDGSGIVLSAKRPETRVFDSIDVAVHGRSFPTRAVTENLAVDYPAPHSGYFNLGLLHTALTGAEGHDTYSPCTPEYLTQKGYDYWALGHIHTPADHALEGGPPIVFPGNLQGRHAGECGARGCRIIEFDASGKLKQQFHCIDLVRWERCQLDVSSIDHVDDVADLYRDYLEAGLAAAMNSDASGSFENAFAAALTVTRVDLVGTTELHAKLHRQSDGLRTALQAVALAVADDRVWMEDLKVRTQAPPTDDPFLGAHHDRFSGDELDAQQTVANPLASLRQTIDKWKTSPDLSARVEAELQPLIKKLGQDSAGLGDPIRVEDPEWLAEILEAAAAEMTGRME